MECRPDTLLAGGRGRADKDGGQATRAGESRISDEHIAVLMGLVQGGVLTTPHRWQHQYSPPPASEMTDLASIPDDSSSARATALGTVESGVEETTGFDVHTAT